MRLKLFSLTLSFFIHFILLLIGVVLAQFLLPKVKQKVLEIDLTTFKVVEAEKPHQDSKKRILQTQPLQKVEKIKEEKIKREENKIASLEENPKELKEAFIPEQLFPLKDSSKNEAVLMKSDSALKTEGGVTLDSQNTPTLSKSNVSNPSNTLTYQEEYLKTKLSVISSIVRKHLNYPFIAQRMGWEGEVLIRFLLTPEGEIEKIEIVKSTGYEVLDKNAVEAVKKSAPLFPKPEIKVKLFLPVRYALQ